MKQIVVPLSFRAVLLVTLLSIFSLSAKTIRGKVVDSKGNGLAGATIQVQNKQGITTSSSDGLFALDIEGSAVLNTNLMKKKSLENSIIINVQKNSLLNLSLRSLSGRRVQSNQMRLNSGEHQFLAGDLISGVLAPGFYILTTECKGLLTHHKVLSNRTGKVEFVSRQSLSKKSKSRGKKRVIDTLEVSLGGFFLEKVALDSYEDLTEDVVLLRLSDKLSIVEDFNFEGRVLYKEGSGDSVAYVGENFTVPTSVSHDGIEYALSWNSKSSEAGKSGTISVSGGEVSVTRGPLSESASAYSLCASAVLNDKQVELDFDFKVLTEPFKVMVWNIWGKNGQDPALNYIYEGTTYTQRERIAMLMKHYKADVIGVVETYGNRPFLLQQLGFEHSTYIQDSESYLGNLSILSRYPVTKDITFGSEHNHMGSDITISDERQLIFYSTWFTSSDMCQWMKVPTISDQEGIEWDKKGRLDAAKRVINNIKSNGFDATANEKPVIVVGDHNTISHLDYIESTVGLPQNYGRGVIKNPVSSHFTENGFTDSYREVKPDPIEFPALSHDPLSGYVNSKVYSPTGWHIRIDFIYYQSKALVPVESVIVDRFLDGKTIGISNKGQYAFPSDHAAFVTTFEWLD